MPHERRKDPHAVILGRRGGLKGGHARARSLSQSRRSEIARLANQSTRRMLLFERRKREERHEERH